MRTGDLWLAAKPVPEWQKLNRNRNPRRLSRIGVSGAALSGWCKMAKRKRKQAGRDAKGRFTKSAAGRKLARKVGRYGHWKSCRGKRK